MTARHFVLTAVLGTTAALMLLISPTPALADCALTQKEQQEVLKAFPAAQSAERANRPKEALALYAKAQGVLCDPNPNAAEAARRAAPLALPLGKAAEQHGQFDEAFLYYEQGGHYAAADRALLAHLRQHADDVSLVSRHITHFADRTLEAFAVNHKEALAAAGPYQVDPALRAELEGMPAKGVARALAKETTSFDERYLAERLALVQSRPEPSPAAMAAMQASLAAEQAFQQKWQTDPVKDSQTQLHLARQWAVVAPNDEALQRNTEARTLALAEQRAHTLTSKYAGVPEFLDAAATYYRSVDYLKPAEPRVAAIRTQAATLGDQARGKGRLSLAIDYYELAGLQAKAEALRAEQRQTALAQAKPEIDAARRSADAIAAQFSNPAAIEALKKQAEAARAAIEASKAKPATREQGKSDLERELGLR